MRKAISAVVIKDGRILLVKKNQTWILPGGKPRGGESDVECLCREFKEELPETKIEVGEFYHQFIGKTPHKGDILENLVYFANLEGNTDKTAREIRESGWFYYQTSCGFNLSDITRKILESLENRGYL